METIGAAAFTSWAWDGRVVGVLLAAGIVYLRGWFQGRRHSRGARDISRLASFLSGLLALFVALESPLDTFDTLFLSAHMIQHLMLMSIAPPLLLLGDPTLPFLRGLPRGFVKDGLGPFLSWPALRRVLQWIVWPPVAWVAFALSTILWHLPKFYELALRSTVWHGAQHACFFWTGILFWWPVLRGGQGRAGWPRWAMIPYLLLGDVLNTALSAFLIFFDRVLYPSYAGVRLSGFTAQQDQAAAGAIMWVPGSVVYLVPAIVIAVRLLGPEQAGRRKRLTHLFRPYARTPRRFRLSFLRRVMQSVLLVLAVAVMWDGFFGQQVAALNLAGVLPWIYWRGLSLAALLLVGNLFCMACPFMLVRDIGRRVLPAKLRWPRALRSKWLPAALLLLYLWTYEAYSLWDSPWLTAWIIAGYFVSALVVDGIFRGASFCKYVCPIGQFHFVSSLLSPGEIRVRSREVCSTCRTHDCIRGNARARGCELHLFQPRKAGNLDCTFCLDCVQACPHDNVALLSIAPASTLTMDPYRSSLGRLSRRTDIAMLAGVIVSGAFVNAAGMVSPVMQWEHRWHARLGMPGTVGAFVLTGTLILPALALLVCVALNRLAGLSAELAAVVRRFIFALVPVGVGMWAAHLLYHLAASRSGVPGWVAPGQILLLDAGLLLTLYVCWQVARQSSRSLGAALQLTAPWALLSCAAYGTGVWILLQPMQMRGMLH